MGSVPSCLQAEKKVEQVLSENTSLQGKLSSLTASMEEMKALSTQKEANLQAQADSRYQAMEGQLDKVRAWLMEAEKQLVLAQEQAKTKEEALKEKESKLEELTKKSTYVHMLCTVVLSCTGGVVCGHCSVELYWRCEDTVVLSCTGGVRTL